MIQYDMIWYNKSWAYKWEWLARCATHGNSTNLWLKLGFFLKKKIPINNNACDNIIFEFG